MARIEPKDCPKCFRAMKYTFPIPRADLAVDAVLDRFQHCGNKWCNQRYPVIYWDVTDWTSHLIKLERKTYTDNGVDVAYTIDGKYYKSVDQWVRFLGIVGPSESAGPRVPGV